MLTSSLANKDLDLHLTILLYLKHFAALQQAPAAVYFRLFNQLYQANIKLAENKATNLCL